MRWQTGLIGAPSGARPWLKGTGSLTRQLKRNFAALAVRECRQQRTFVWADEVLPSGVPAGSKALIRNVCLQNEGVPLVFAHSVFPNRSLVGGWRSLSRLKSRSLGEVLFGNRRTHRKALQFALLSRRHRLYREAMCYVGDVLPLRLWARRSIFRQGTRRILVTELFLPVLWKGQKKWH